MAYWLLKTEPDCYNWDDLKRDKKTVWDGVANALALKHIRSMKKGDQAVIYHTGKERQAVGLATIVSEPYPDPKEDDEKLAVVDIKIDKPLTQPVTLSDFKADPAFEGFDACSAGIVEMNHGVSYYWAGKTFAAQYFATVPFGMSFMGHHAWLYHGGGIDLWNEVYKPFNVVAMPVGCSGVQMTGWFKKPVESVSDFNGLKMRIPGLAGRMYADLGVDVKLLPGGEIFPALERGVIDAAEWVGPYLDRRLGLQNAAKYYYTTGWHEPATTSEIVINQGAWDKLPKDLQAIVRAAADATNQEGLLWLDAKNGEALSDMVDNFDVKIARLPDDVIKALRESARTTLEDAAAKDPMVKKVHESFFNFKKNHDKWNQISETTFQTTVR